MTRRYYALAALAALAVAGGAAAIVIFAFGVGNGGGKTLTRKEYLDRIQAICRVYDRQLQRVPPPANPGNAQLLAQSIGRALPLLEERLIETRNVTPPDELAKRVERALALADVAVNDLKTSRRKALAGDARGAIVAFAHFVESRDRARDAGQQVGFRC